MTSTQTRARAVKPSAKPDSVSQAPARRLAASAELSQRARQLLDCEVDFIGNREFAGCGAKQQILSPPLADTSADGRRTTPLPKDLPPHLARLCESPLLSADQECSLFRRMNYLKFRANVLRSRLDPDRPAAETIADVEHCLQEAHAVRDQIIRANMRLVISIVKKYVTPRHSFDDLLSDGISTLMQAVDKFDYARGFRFSTYAYRAIARSAYRSISDRYKEDARFESTASEGLANVAEDDRVSPLDEQERSRMRSQMLQLMNRLDRRERFILRGRFALGAHRHVRTFQCLADKLGVSKERVRQLEQRAIAKLRAMIEQSQADENCVSAA